MTNKVVFFDKGEFEIALVTYNRYEFVIEWMKHCYEQAKERNIHISVYDGSTNDDTRRYVDAFNIRWKDANIEYHHVGNCTIGYKPMFPLLQSKSKYVWVSGDSRYQDFDLMDKKVFPYLKDDIDCAVLFYNTNDENDGKIYTNREEFLRDCFISMTCIGMSIYKTALFEPLKHNEALKAECDRKYKDNYGWSWLGYFFEMFAEKEHKAVFAVIPTMDIKPEQKRSTWMQRHFNICIGGTCDLMDGLSNKYQCTEKVLKDFWKYTPLYRASSCYTVRKGGGDWNQDTYKKYKENGMLERCTPYWERMERFANVADADLDKLCEQEIEAEKKEFERLCCKSIKEIKNMSRGQSLWIYGAGTGGKILLKCLSEHGIHVCGFLDNAAESIRFCEGIPVKAVNDINPENCCIIISLRWWEPFCVSTLLKRGVARNKILYISMEIEDLTL